ncbi:SDR family NAD(P)-dependent oxidoreductase [Sphingomonas naphthae]|uniref:SDR family NAD(P)-dependent oxidoreductase n=1 Tax=Sphingomonas naphthae TaxID=1813468 RepID=A0ABY7TK45_9SPHN|nr:SDR family NAD(P)-dependent oxidoreductase [Sphingomonas naphthae]WCT73597.1 SDR family NAD(P)-dependent oxidoreductase [Sphingomonas naphthae]
MADDIRFDGRAILVTGAGRGIGAAQAMLLAARGARVVVADKGAALDGEGKDQGPADSVVAAIRAAGGEAVACAADIATEAGATAAVHACIDAFGRIDGLCHYASTSPDLTTADALSTPDLDLVMRINPMAGLWLARAAWPHMAAAGYGRIVLTTSAGIYGSFGNAPYAAAKAAVIGAIRCLAIEGAAHGILANAVAPAAWTRMTDRLHESAFTRWFSETMTPDKVAPPVAFLLSDACATSGETFAIGGGRVARIAFAETGGAFDVATIEQARDALPGVLSADDWLFPRDLTERSGAVTALYGLDLRLEASGGIAVRPIAKE